MATFTDTVRTRDAAGIRARRVLDLAGPDSYTTGGDPITAGELRLGVIEHIPDFLAYNGTAVRLVHYDPDNETLVWIVPNTGAEVANGTDLSDYVARIEPMGKG